MSNPKHSIPKSLPEPLLRLPLNARLNVSELCKLLNMPHSTLNDWIKRGDFPKPDCTMPRLSNSKDVRYWKVRTVRMWHKNFLTGGELT